MNTRRHFAASAVALAFALGLFLSSCGGGGGENRGIVANTYAFAGRVVDESGSPIAGVSVRVNGGTAVTTDAAGGFSAALPVPGASGASVQLALSMSGYVPGYKMFRMAVDDVAAGGSYTGGDIPLRREPATAAESTQVKVVHADGSSESLDPVVGVAGGLPVAQAAVTVAAGDRAVTFFTPAADGESARVSLTLGDAAGAGPNAADVLGATGSYTGVISYGDPTDMADLAAFPGDFTTTSDTGAAAAGQGALITAGFARISLTDSAGQPVTQFASGTVAGITMRVPATAMNPETGSPVAAGDTIPVFLFNESTGEWVVENDAGGSVKRATVQSDAQGLFVTFTTTHLSWFNLDWKADTCEDWKPKVSLVDGSGAPVPGARYYALISGWTSTQTDYENTGLMYFLRSPSGLDWKLWAESSGLASEVVTIHNCAHSVTGQSDITLTLGSACAPACGTDAQCDDGNTATLDECSAAGTCAAACVHSENACRADSDCDDQNSETSDSCLNPGTTSSTCLNTSYQISCNIDAQCDDANPESNDVCWYDYDQTQSGCANFPNQCESNADCDDGNASTTDSCYKIGSIWKQCVNVALCGTNADCDDGIEATTDYCAPGYAGPDYCMNTYSSSCTDPECTTSQPDSVGFCVYPSPGYTTCAYALGCSSDNECNDNWSDTQDTCGTSVNGTQYCVNRECSSDSGCDDGDAGTEDVCYENDDGSSWCWNNISCSVDSDCDTQDPDMIDVCVNTDPYRNPFCYSTYPKCQTDTDCDDNNSGTLNVCVNPGTLAAHCNFPLTGARALPAARIPAQRAAPSAAPGFPQWNPFLFAAPGGPGIPGAPQPPWTEYRRNVTQ